MNRFGGLLLTGLLTAVMAGSAWADWPHHHPRSSVRMGVYIGDPWLFPPFPHPYYGPHIYVPPTIVVTPPPVYVEQRGLAVPATPETGYWHYCREAGGYYPDVKTCPGGWQKVPPRPPQ